MGAQNVLCVRALRSNQAYCDCTAQRPSKQRPTVPLCSSSKLLSAAWAVAGWRVSCMRKYEAASTDRSHPKKHHFYPSHFVSYLLKTSSKWDDNTWVSARCIAFRPEICSCLLLYLQYYDTNNKDFIKLTKINIQKAGHKKRPLQPKVRWEN